MRKKPQKPEDVELAWVTLIHTDENYKLQLVNMGETAQQFIARLVEKHFPAPVVKVENTLPLVGSSFISQWAAAVKKLGFTMNHEENDAVLTIHLVCNNSHLATNHGKVVRTLPQKWQGKIVKVVAKDQKQTASVASLPVRMSR